MLSAFVTARMHLWLMYITASLYLVTSVVLRTQSSSHSTAAAERHALFGNPLLSTVHHDAELRVFRC